MASSARKNVLFMIPSLYGGGAEKVTCLLASALVERHNVTVGYCFEKPIRYDIDPRCRLVCIDVNEGALVRRFGKYGRFMEWTHAFWKLKRQCAVDVSISLLRAMNQINVLSRTGERVICSERCNPRKWEPQYFNRTRVINRMADHVVFQSRLIQSLYGKRIREHSSVILNPVSVPCLASEARQHRIVSAGRLAEQKNQRMLIRAFAAFHGTHPDYTLSIYGEGDLEDVLRDEIRQLGLEDCAFLHGNRKDVHEQIRDAEMFVLSSDFEGLSNALLECMTMGIACISTACEGSVDVIRDGENGLLVDIGDEAGLAHAMGRLADDPELRRSLERQSVIDAEAFRIDRVVEAWEKLII